MNTLSLYFSYAFHTDEKNLHRIEVSLQEKKSFLLIPYSSLIEMKPNLVIHSMKSIGEFHINAYEFTFTFDPIKFEAASFQLITNKDNHYFEEKIGQLISNEIREKKQNSILFLYDLKFENNNLIYAWKSPPKTIKIPFFDQFSYFLDVIDKNPQFINELFSRTRKYFQITKSEQNQPAFLDFLVQRLKFGGKRELIFPFFNLIEIKYFFLFEDDFKNFSEENIALNSIYYKFDIFCLIKNKLFHKFINYIGDNLNEEEIFKIFTEILNADQKNLFCYENTIVFSQSNFFSEKIKKIAILCLLKHSPNFKEKMDFLFHAKLNYFDFKQDDLFDIEPEIIRSLPKIKLFFSFYDDKVLCIQKSEDKDNTENQLKKENIEKESQIKNNLKPEEKTIFEKSLIIEEFSQKILQKSSSDLFFLHEYHTFFESYVVKLNSKAKGIAILEKIWTALKASLKNLITSQQAPEKVLENLYNFLSLNAGNQKLKLYVDYLLSMEGEIRVLLAKLELVKIKEILTIINPLLFRFQIIKKKHFLDICSCIFVKKIYFEKDLIISLEALSSLKIGFDSKTLLQILEQIYDKFNQIVGFSDTVRCASYLKILVMSIYDKDEKKAIETHNFASIIWKKQLPIDKKYFLSCNIQVTAEMPLPLYNNFLAFLSENSMHLSFSLTELRNFIVENNAIKEYFKEEVGSQNLKILSLLLSNITDLPFIESQIFVPNATGKLECFLFFYKKFHLDFNNMKFFSQSIQNFSLIYDKLIGGTYEIPLYLKIGFLSEVEKQIVFECLSLSKVNNEFKINASLETLTKLFNKNHTKGMRIELMLKNVMKFFQIYMKKVEEAQPILRKVDYLLLSLNQNSIEYFKKSEELALLKKFHEPSIQFNQLHNSGIFCSILKRNEDLDETAFSNIDIRMNNLQKSERKLISISAFFKSSPFESDWKLKKINMFTNDIQEEKEVMFFLKQEIVEEDNIHLKALKWIKNFKKTKKHILLLLEFINNFAGQESKILKNFRKNLSEPNLTLKEFFKEIDKIHLSIYGKIITSEKLLEIIRNLSSAGTLMQFVSDKSEEDIRGLVEFVEDVGDSFLKVSVVHDLLKVLNFNKKIRPHLSLIEEAFIENFLNVCSEPSFQNIAAYIQSTSEQINSLIQLYQKVSNREEFSKGKIREIYEFSEITIALASSNKRKKDSASSYYDLNQAESSYFLETHYGTDLKKKIDLNSLAELKDRSLLLANKPLIYKKDKNEEEDKDINEHGLSFLKICAEFSKCIESSIQILGTLTKLYYLGYPEENSIRIKVTNGVLEIYNQRPDNKQEISIEELQSALLKQKLKWEEEILMSYRNSKYLPYLHGRQINLILNYFERGLMADNDDQKVKIDFLLKFVSNHHLSIKNTAKMKIKRGKEDNLTFIDRTFEKLLFEKNITSIYGKGSKALNNLKDKIYTAFLSPNNFESDLLTSYVKFSGELPLLQTLLICNSQTSLEQITSFIYRAYTCQERKLFFLVKADHLDFEKQVRIIEIIFDLLELDLKTMSSILTFVYNNPNAEFVCKLKRLDFVGKIDFEGSKYNLQRNDLKELGINCFVVNSICSGMGKSQFIRTFASEKKLNWVYFPISGEINRESLASRFKLLHLGRDSLLHVDIGETTKYDLLIQFLFYLIVCRGFLANDELFYLPNEITLFIEIPNSMNNEIARKASFLSVFEQITIDHSNLDQMLISGDPMSKEQIIGNVIESYQDKTIQNVNFKVKKCDCEFGHHLDCCFNFNSQNLKVLAPARCRKLILQTCMSKINEKIEEKLGRKLNENERKMPNFYQVQSFISILDHQFKQFLSSYAFSISHLKLNQEVRHKNYLISRSHLIKCLIDLSYFFIFSCYQDLIDNQAKEFRDFMDDEKNKEGLEIYSNDRNILSFQEMKKTPMIFFNDDDFSISIICNKKHELYSSLLDLWNSSEYKLQNALIDYENASHDILVQEMKKILNVHIDQEVEIGQYVFTPDNFIKMVLINLKIRSGIPVIMMGETGCGKTSLIKMMAKIKGCSFRILNVHAGIDDEQIALFIEKISKKAEKKVGTVWAFLDEINTSHSISLISEIICKHTYLGKSIAPNIVFIAACNPYRLKKSANVNYGFSKGREQKVMKLAYSVNTLPHSLMNYVFDFGSLRPEDEFKYIEYMLRQVITNKDRLRKTINTIINSQKWIRDETNEIFNVSLRDVRRFIINYQWFRKSIKSRTSDHMLNDSKFEALRTYHQVQPYYSSDKSHHKNTKESSVVLALILVYYVRLIEKSNRQKYLDSLSKWLGMSVKDIENIIKREQIDIFCRFKCPEGVAPNKALLENLFTVFVSVINKIPVFICGKPGCSKTLSVQILYSNMRGSDSSDSFLKTLPRIFMNSYQGSQTSTSKGVLRVFQKARELLKKDDKATNREELISLLFFDELGLAEIAPSNPVKVLHAELELDQQEEQVSFVGISNWTLDASKMNRGVFLARPDPDEEDLIETAKIIAESIESGLLNKFQDFFVCLAKTYSSYKIELLKQAPQNQDFHGTRDFYYLIKQAARQAKEAQNLTKQELLEVGFECLDRNFGGLHESTLIIRKIFGQILDAPLFESQLNQNASDYNKLRAIQENLRDPSSRYPMIITKPSLAYYLLGFVFEPLGQNFDFLTGSFFGDKVKESYSFKVLNKIMVSMENGGTLVLNDLEFIYPNLYDVFNSNFSMVGGKKFTRIALGTTNNPLAPVHPNFKFLIIVNPDHVLEQDPPLLQRFEKHIFSFRDLLTEREEEIAKKVLAIFADAKESKDKSHKFNSGIKQNCLNCSEDEIYGLTKKFSLKKNTNKEIEDEILKVISATFSQEFLAALKVSKLENEEIIDKIYTYYTMLPHHSFSAYFEHVYTKETVIKELTERNNNLHIIYTYSSIYEDLKYNKIFVDKQTDIIAVSRFQEEAEFEGYFYSEFISNDQKRNLILKFQTVDCIHLNSIKFLIDPHINEIIQNKKQVFFIIHLDKLKATESFKKVYGFELEPISNLSNNWNQIMIDNISPQHNLEIIQCISATIKNILLEKLNLSDIIHRFLYTATIKIVYTLNNVQFDVESHRKKLILLFSKKKIIDLLITRIQRCFDDQTEWIQKLLYGQEYFQKNLDLLSIIENYITSRVESILARLIGELEKRNSLGFFFEKFENKLFKTKLFDIWRNIFDKIEIIDPKPISNAARIVVDSILPNICLPSSFMSFEEALSIFGEDFSSYLKEYNINEENLRGLNISSEEFEVNRRRIHSQFENYLQNKTNFRELASSDKVLAEKWILKDFLNYYLIKILKETRFQENYITFLTEIVKFQFNNDLPSIILWLQVYRNSIKSLLFILQNEFTTTEFQGKIRSNDYQNVKILNEDKNYELKKPVNYVFLVVLESRIDFYIPNLEKLRAMDFNNFFSYFENLKAVFQEMQQFDISLHLFSSKISDLSFWIELFSLITPELDLKTNTEEFISLIEEIVLLFRPFRKAEEEGNLKALIQAVRRTFQENLAFFLQKQGKQLLPEKKKEINKFMINFYMGLFQKASTPQLRIFIFESVFEDENLVSSSKKMVSLVLQPYVPDVEIFLEERIEGVMKLLEELVNTKNKYVCIIEEKLSTFAKSRLDLQNIILYFFEYKFSSFFAMVDRQESIFTEEARELFKIGVRLLCIHPTTFKVKNITIIYLIALIKSYINVMVKYLKQTNDHILAINEIINPKGSPSSSSKILKMIKLYVLKMFWNNYKETFENFKEMDFNKLHLKWAYSFLERETDEDLQTNSIFLSFNNFENFKKTFIVFSQLQKENFQPTKKIESVFSELDSSSLINLFDCLINNVIPKMLKKDFIKSVIFENYKNWIKLNKKNFSAKFDWPILVRNTLNFCSKHNDLKFLKFNNIKSKVLDMKLLAYKATLLVFTSGKNGAYGNILQDLNQSVFAAFLPGGDRKNKDIVDSGFRKIKNLLFVKGKGANEGVYVCSCGKEYLVPYCSFPTNESRCEVCLEIIGGRNHIIHDRPGHFRIYKDEKQLSDLKKQFTSPNNYVNYKMFREFEEDYLNEVNLSPPGYHLVDFNKFKNPTHAAGDQTVLSYRFLNFILHAIILVSFDVQLISDEAISKICTDNYSFLVDRLTASFKIMHSDLKLNNIDEPFIFINKAFEQFYELINDIKPIHSKRSCSSFEKKVEDMLNSLKNDFPLLKSEYRKNYYQIRTSNIECAKVLLEESVPFEYYHDLKEEYPFLELFMKLKIGDESDLLKQFNMDTNLQSNNPLTHLLLTSKKELELLNALPVVNKMSNFFIDYYSLRITRAEAKEKTIRAAIQEISNGDQAKELFENFAAEWENKLYRIAVKFQCQPEMSQKRKIKYTDALADILNDDRETNHGMYIAALYHQMIDYQNNFINNLLEKISLNTSIYFYKPYLEREIIIQDGLPNQILRSDSMGEFDSFDEIIYNYSICNRKYGSGYEVFYDYEGIEYELVKAMLPGVCKFKESKEQKFITYAFEMYRNNNTGLIQIFRQNYQQIDLTNNERHELFEFCQYCSDSAKLLQSLEVLLSYYQRANQHRNLLLREAIDDLPAYIFVEDKLKQFLKRNDSLSLCHLVDVYEYIELLNYEKIVSWVPESYKICMSEEMKKSINSFFENEAILKVLSKRNLCTILRRFMCRFLTFGSNMAPEIEISEIVSVREDIRPKEIKNGEQFDQVLNELKNISIQIHHTFDLYNHLGKDLDYQVNGARERKEMKTRINFKSMASRRALK